MRPEHERLIEGLVGAPYLEGSDGPGSFDCYGLARFIYGSCGLTDLPSLLRPQGQAACGEAIARALAEHPELKSWYSVQEPQDFDVAVMANVAERRRHIGVCARLKGEFWIVHAQDAPVNRVLLDDLPSLQAKGFNRIEFYRRR